MKWSGDRLKAGVNSCGCMAAALAQLEQIICVSIPAIWAYAVRGKWEVAKYITIIQSRIHYRANTCETAPIRVGDHAPRAEGYKVRHADTLLMLTVLSLQVCLVMITKQN